MRITFLTHYFPPEVGAPQARIGGLARALSKRGLEVTVHTCAPHYPDGNVRAGYRNRLFQQDDADGVRVVRSLVYPAANKGFVPRLADQASFAVSSLATLPLTGGADVVVAESPPLFTAAAAIGYRAAKRAALVVNIADRWPASAVELGALRQPQLIGAATALEHRVYRAADVIAVPTRSLEAALGAVPDARGKVVHLPPAVDLARFEPQWQESTGGPLRVLYAGTVGLAQGLDTLLDAAALAGPDVVSVTIAGGGAEAEALSQRPPENVRFLGLVPSDDIPALYADAEAAVVLLKNRPILAGALPTKLVEAMGAGRPAIVSARGEAADFVEGAGAGIVVPPEDPEHLATAFRRLRASLPMRRRLGQSGRAYAERELGLEASVDRWLQVFDRAVTRR